MSKWQEVSLGDVADFVTDKIAASNVTLDSYISTDNMQVDRGGVVAAVTLPKASKFNHYKPTDTLFSNIRTYFRKVWLADRTGGASPDVLIFRAKDESQLNPLYLYYILSGQEFIDYTVLTSKGAKMPRGDKDAIMQFKLPLPCPDEQIDIAESLSCIDQKIELNQRMNETLDGMARSIFKSWFVDFDPVRAKAEGREPEGMDSATAALFPSTFTPNGLPEGWKVDSIGENFEIFDNKRIPLSSRERENRKGVYPYYGATSIMDYVDDFIFEGVHVLIGEDGSVIKEDGTPFMQYVWGQFWVNNHAHVLKGLKPVCNEHIYLHLLNENVTPYITGAVQLKINQANLKRIPFVRATDEVCVAFAENIQPLFAKIRANSEQNKTLAALRDTLLPKLISGELRVDTASEKLKEAVA